MLATVCTSNLRSRTVIEDWESMAPGRWWSHRLRECEPCVTGRDSVRVGTSALHRAISGHIISGYSTRL